MPRANPNTYATKWLAESNAMTDEEHAAEDLKSLNRKQLCWFMNECPEYAKYLARQRDKLPRAEFWNDVKPFSLWKS
jgi:hypothetical protein